MLNQQIIPAKSELEKITNELNYKSERLTELTAQLQDEELLLEKKRNLIDELDSKEKAYTEKLSKLSEDILAQEEKCKSIKSAIVELSEEEDQKQYKVNELSSAVIKTSSYLMKRSVEFLHWKMMKRKLKLVLKIFQ